MIWKHWLIGLANAAVSGIAGAVGGFAVGVTWRQALEIAAISAAVSISKWMLQHPLPGAGDNSGMIQAPGANSMQSGKSNTGAKP